MTLHLALAAGGQKSLLLDRRPQQSQQGDPRALALSHGARQLLEQINAWPARAATPIETIHVSQKDGFGRTVIDRADYDLPALGYVVRYRDLAAALARNCRPTPCSTPSTSSTSAMATTTSPSRCATTGVLRTLRAKAADPRRRHTRRRPGRQGQRLPPARGDLPKSHRNRATTSAPGNASRRTARSPCCRSATSTRSSSRCRRPRPTPCWRWTTPLSPPRCRRQFGQRMSFTNPGPRSRFPLALRMRETLVQGQRSLDRQHRANPAPGLRPGLQPRPARRLATRRNIARKRRRPRAAWPAMRPAAASTATAAPSSPTRSSAPSPTISARSSWPAASACWPSTSSRRPAISSPSA
jgi:2-octaprenyl-6-methoxyphenol hydroxylase